VGDFLTEIEKHNSACRADLLRRVLDTHNGFKFEELVSRVLSKMGFEEIEVTQKTRDGGVDVRAVSISCGGHMRVRVAVQAKRYDHKLKVSAKEVREIRGSLNAHETGLIITTSSFTKDALSEARSIDKAPISLIDGKSFVDFLVQYEIGVKRDLIEVLRLNP